MKQKPSLIFFGHPVVSESNNCEEKKRDKEENNHPVPPVHVEIPKFKCNKCEFKAIREEDKLSHFQSTHLISKVDLSLTDQTAIRCNQCEYRCRYTIQLKKQMKKEHNKYKCK